MVRAALRSRATLAAALPALLVEKLKTGINFFIISKYYYSQVLLDLNMSQELLEKKLRLE
jgi:hypothetical protein